MSSNNGPLQDLLGSASIRMPEVSIRTMKQPPMLPSSSQKYFYNTPDATINAGGTQRVTELLEETESTENFAYGEANRLGTQSGYLNVPHMAQKHICPLVLPNAKRAEYGNEPFVLPFPHLRKGDIAFYLRLQSGNWEVDSSQQQRHPLSLVCKDWKDVKKRRMDEAMSKSGQVFLNLQTVNYILHGIQYYRDSEPYWRDAFWRGFGLDKLDPIVYGGGMGPGARDMEALCTHIVRWCMTPFGVVASDAFNISDQGVAMVVDGR